MNARAQSQVQSSATPSFTPAPVNIAQRKCACGGSAGLSGECAECQKDKLVGTNHPFVQTKLKISQPNDKYEQEADRVADEVMRMPEPKVQRQLGVEEDENEETIQTKLIASKITPLVQRQVADEEDEEQTIQTKATASRNNPTDSSDVQCGIENLKQNTGNRLPQDVRDFMESRFGHNFNQVKIHTDNKAVTSAQSLNARAYTLGQDVVFGAGQYSPDTRSGRQLLAHELTHVIQQSNENKVQVVDQVDKTRGPSRITRDSPSVIYRRPGDDDSGYREAIVSVKWSKDSAILTRRLTGAISSSKDFNVPRTAIVVPLIPATKSFHRKHIERHLNDKPLKEGAFANIQVSAFYTPGDMLENVRIAVAEDVGKNKQPVELPEQACGPQCYDSTGNVLSDEQLPDSCSQVCVDQPNFVIDEETEAVKNKDEEPTKDKKICGPDITDWLINQINDNENSSEVAEMRKRNDDDITGLDLSAAYDWYELVKTGGPWDFKQDLGASISSIESCRQNCSGSVFSITLDNQCMTFEVAANIHFGYVGRAAGFSGDVLLDGASIAQILEFRGETKDDIRDVQAIKKGFDLFNTGSPNGLNNTGLEKNYYDQLPSRDGDPDGCEPCSKKLL
ncbi:MAG: DUF4157 domain-containing protein [Methylococcaceae bacterium]